jgi:hypothetical protein
MAELTIPEVIRRHKALRAELDAVRAAHPSPQLDSRIAKIDQDLEALEAPSAKS